MFLLKPFILLDAIRKRTKAFQAFIKFLTYHREVKNWSSCKLLPRSTFFTEDHDQTWLFFGDVSSYGSHFLGFRQIYVAEFYLQIINPLTPGVH